MLPRNELPDELGPFQFGLLVLSIGLLLGLAAEIVIDLDPEIVRLIFLIDTGVCLLLLIDFGMRFQQAESKLAFLKWGWIDLLASIPAIEIFRWGRLLRIFRVLRLLVAVRSLRRLMHILWRSKTSAGLTGVLVITFLVMSFGSIGVLLAEMHEPGANIRTADDALWWSMTTVTTVGYGDYHPVTLAGRIIASFLMITGIGLFGTLSGVAAGIFLGRDHDVSAAIHEQHRVLERLDATQIEISELRAELSRERERNAERDASSAAD